MDLFSKILIMVLFGIILFVLTFLINRRPEVSKNEKKLIEYGIGTLYIVFIIEFITNTFAPSCKIMLPLYIFAMCGFSGFIISLILIAKKHNNGDVE